MPLKCRAVRVRHIAHFVPCVKIFLACVTSSLETVLICMKGQVIFALKMSIPGIFVQK